MKKYFKYSICCAFFILGAIFFTGCENPDSIKDYSLKSETLVDTCNLSSVDGFYVGKGILDGETHYIFQADKDGKKSQNIDTTAEFVDIEYLPDAKASTASTPPTSTPVPSPAPTTATAAANNTTQKSTPSGQTTTSQPSSNIPIVKAYDRVYVKNKDVKHKYYYKLYIPKNGVKDVGELSTNTDSDDDDDD